MISNARLRKFIREINQKGLSLNFSSVPDFNELHQKAKRKLTGEDPEPWREGEVLDDLRVFASHESLLATADIDEPDFQSKAGEVRSYLAQDSRFARYLHESSKAQGELLNKMVCKVYEILTICSISSVEKKEEIFYQFPPRSEGELKCFPGSINRFNSVIGSASEKTPFEAVLYESYNSVLTRFAAEAVGFIRDYPQVEGGGPENEAYHIHAPEYLEYLLGLTSIAESNNDDPFMIFISGFLPQDFKCRVAKEFFPMVDAQIKSSLESEGFYEGHAQYFLNSALRGAIKKANGRGGEDVLGAIISDDFDFSEVRLDEYTVCDSCQGASKDRISASIVAIINDVFDYYDEGVDPENISKFIENYCVLAEVRDGDMEIYRIDMEKLSRFFVNRSKGYFADSMESLTADYRKADFMKINSREAVRDLHPLLSSNDVNEVKSAIDAIFLMSDFSNGGAAINFVESMIMRTKDGESLQTLLRDMVENKEFDKKKRFDFLHQDEEFKGVYLERIAADVSGSDLRSGILSRLRVKEELHRDRLQKRGAQDFFSAMSIDDIFSLSTEDLCTILTSPQIYKDVSDYSLIENFVQSVYKRVDRNNLLASILLYSPNEFLERSGLIPDTLSQDLSADLVAKVRLEDFPDSKVNLLFSMAIRSVAKDEDLVAVMRKFSDGIDLSLTDYIDENSLLQIAIESEKYGLSKVIIREMHEKEIDINTVNEYDKNALDIALANIIDYPGSAKFEDFDLIICLLQNGAVISEEGFVASFFYKYILEQSDEILSSAEKGQLLDSFHSLGPGHAVNNFIPYDPISAYLNDSYVVDADDLVLINNLIQFGSAVDEQIEDGTKTIVDLVLDSTSLDDEQKKGFISILRNTKNLEKSEVLMKSVTSTMRVESKKQIFDFLLAEGVDMSQTFFDYEESVSGVEKMGVLYFVAINDNNGVEIFRHLLTRGAILDHDSFRGIMENLESNLDCQLLAQGIIGYRDILIARLEEVDNLVSLFSEAMSHDDPLLARSALLFRDQKGETAFQKLADRIIDNQSLRLDRSFLEQISQFVADNRATIGEDLALRLDAKVAQIILDSYMTQSRDLDDESSSLSSSRSSPASANDSGVENSPKALVYDLGTPSPISFISGSERDSPIAITSAGASSDLQDKSLNREESSDSPRKRIKLDKEAEKVPDKVLKGARGWRPVPSDKNFNVGFRNL